MTKKRYKIFCIPGDGIGPEVLNSGKKILHQISGEFGFSLEWETVDWGSEYFLKNGKMMPADGIQIMAQFDSIYLGAVGTPEIPDHETLWGLLIPIRREFDQYINLRPIKSYEGIVGPLSSKKSIDMVIVRENTEGEYSSIGGRYAKNTERETALQVNVFSRFGIERVVNFAINLARSRNKKLVSATKSNGITFSMPFWDQVVNEQISKNTDISLRHVLIDALSADLVLHPENFDVIVGSNLFGDILSDLAAAIVGSIGIAPSGNLNPEAKYPSMFEPIHGSAPDIQGKGIANPVGAILAGAMMLENLGELQAAQEIERRINALLGAGVSTFDLGGSENTNSFTEKLLQLNSR